MSPRYASAATRRICTSSSSRHSQRSVRGGAPQDLEDAERERPVALLRAARVRELEENTPDWLITTIGRLAGWLASGVSSNEPAGRVVMSGKGMSDCSQRARDRLPSEYSVLLAAAVAHGWFGGSVQIAAAGEQFEVRCGLD